MQIKAEKLKTGDVFLFNNKEQVAIEPLGQNYLWVTNRSCYLQKEDLNNGKSYGYTSATLMSIYPDDDVELIENIDR